jgi:hypothetical protein
MVVLTWVRRLVQSLRKDLKRTQDIQRIHLGVNNEEDLDGLDPRGGGANRFHLDDWIGFVVEAFVE